jgi:hypothetical protein
MKQVPDRKKLRREYVKQQRSAFAHLVIGGTVLLPTTLLAAGFAIFTILGCILSLLNGTLLGVLFCLFAGGGLTLGCSFLALMGYNVIKEGTRLQGMPYVPPVTPDAFPADEILVRGSEEPSVAQSEVLLRATNEKETPKEELLRAGNDL